MLGSYSPIIPEWLQECRAKIDAIDDEIIALLDKRCGIVAKVGQMKSGKPTGKSHIRPGREADMVRRIYEKCSKTNFPAEAAIAMWRTIIAASTGIETALSVSAYAPEEDLGNYWLAREYFGPFTPITTQPHINRVIGDVMDGKAEVGIVPVPQGEDTDPWWRMLARRTGDWPKIFAYLPFVTGQKGGNRAAALAIAKVEPEQTGEDISYLAIDAEDLSTHRLQQSFSKAEMVARVVQVHPLSPTRRHILSEIDGFFLPESENYQNFLSALGENGINVAFLGSYAAPIMIEGTDHSHDPASRPRPHVKPSAHRATKSEG